ncbi:hypothetical protein [Sorangium sp. So ce176]
MPRVLDFRIRITGTAVPVLATTIAGIVASVLTVLLGDIGG